MPPDGRKPAPGNAPGSVYFEFIQSGNYMRVSAIDERTGIEATIVGDAKAPRAVLEQIAGNKLKRLLETRKT